MGLSPTFALKSVHVDKMHNFVIPKRICELKSYTIANALI